jgi:hypothetical protein
MDSEFKFTDTRDTNNEGIVYVARKTEDDLYGRSRYELQWVSPRNGTLKTDAILEETLSALLHRRIIIKVA